MLESLVASILNRFLGNYVSNLNYDQLNIGVWKGEANLRDLKLRREALDKLDLPINVLEGYLGELTLSIPWSNLKTKPVKVFIENVYLLAVPKSEATLSLDEEEERAQQLKQRRLATAELLSQQKNTKDQQSSEEGDGFISQLTTKVIDNLQVSIKNIHLRFEDHVSDPGHPFAAGITLKELSAVSTDGQWSPTFISEMENTIHKLVTLHSLSMYWNTDATSLAGLPHEKASRIYADLIPDGSNDPKEHQYILKPVSGTGKVKLNKQFGSDIPKTDITLLFDELGVCLDDHQYRDALLLVDLFHVNLKKQKYLKYHPERDPTSKFNPRAYWKFAQSAVVAEIHERNYQWTWDHFRTRRDQRRTYIECYVASKTKKATQEQEEKLTELERVLSFDDIRFYRSLAKNQLKREKIKIEQEKKKNEGQGWFSSWWSGGSSGDKSATDTEDESLVMTEEQKRELYDAIDYDEEKAAIAAAVDMPKDTIKFRINTELQRGSLSLMQHSHTAKRQDLASLVFDTVTVGVTQYIESSRIGVGLRDLRLYDGMTANTLHPKLIGIRQTGRTRSLKDAMHDDSRSSLNEDEPLLTAVLEHKPFSNIADNAISLKTRRLEIIFNPIVIRGVLEFFKPPEHKSESINALLEAAGESLEGFKQQTLTGLEYALNQHTTLAVDMDLDAPLIIIPESCTERHTPCMIIDAGHIRIDSDLANHELANEYKGKKISKEDYQRLESLMYDKFHVQLTQTKLLIGKDVETCLAQQEEDGGQNYVIQRIDMSFVVELCILRRASQFTKFKISGHLPLLSVNISDAKYKVLMGMIDLILDSISTDDGEKSTPEPLPQRQQSLFVGQTSWGSKNDLLLSDADSESSINPSCKSQEQQHAETASTPATPLSATGSIAAASNHYQHEDFRFTFTVDKVSATVQEATDSGDDKPLCELILETFHLDFISRPYDMVVNVSLKTLNVVDDMEHGEEFHYLVTSNAVGGTQQPTGNLVNVKYIQAKRTHPLYHEIYQGFDQTVEIGLSTLSIIVTRSSLLTLYNFILTTFTGPSDSDPQEHQSQRRLSQGSGSKTGSTQAAATAANSSNTIKVDIHMDSLTLILNDDGKRLGTGVLSYGDLKVLLYPSTLKVEGKFGNFTLTDDSATGPTNEYNGASEVYMLSIEGDELADFSYETYDSAAAEHPGYDARFYLRMGALQFKLLDSTKPILDYLSEFLEMKMVYDAAREAAVQQIQQQQETNSRMHFDVTVKSPVVIFPMGDNGDMILAHLGEIRAANEFTEVTRRKHTDLTAAPRDFPVSRIRCGLYDISLRSRSTVTSISEEGAHQKRTLVLPIIDDLNLVFQIESPEVPAPEYGPATCITGNISDIRMALTERQYKWLLDIYNNLMETFLSGGDQEAEKAATDAQVERLSIHSSSVRSQPRPQQKEKEKEKEKERVTTQTNAIQLSMTMDLKTLQLEILAGQDVDPKDWNQHQIARLAFNNTHMSMQTMEDASMLLEVQMGSITFSDTRATSSSQFREIMAPSHLDGPQFQVQLQMPAKHEDQIMAISATVDSPKIVMSLDYVFLLVDFFMKPFAPEPTTEAQAFAKSQRERYSSNANDDRPNGRKQSVISATNSSQRSVKSQPPQPQPQQQDKQMQLHFNANIVDVELVCLAKPESKSSEAVILSFKQLTAVQKQSLVCKLDSIGMVLCRMDSPKGSAIPFIETFDVDLKLETSSTMPGCNVTTIQVDVQPLILRISYQDAMLVMDIINKVVALMGASSVPPPGARGFDDGSMNNNETLAISDSNQQQSEHSENGGSQSQSGTQDTNSLRKIEPYIVMSKESLKARFEGLQFTLIEDLHELPFIDASLQPFTVNASDWSSALSVDMFFTFAATSFNFRNSHWEPVLEPWGFGIKAAQDPATKAMTVKIESKESLDLDITHNFLETLMTVSNSMVQAQQPLPENAQKQMRPYLIRNCTGYSLRFWNMSDDAGVTDNTDSNMHTLKDGEEMPWTFRDWKRRRERRHAGQNLLGIHIEAFDWDSVEQVALDREGVHTYRMKEVNGVRHRLIVDIKLENHVKQVTFRSGLVIQNQTLQRLQLGLTDSQNSKQVSDIWDIEPGSEFAIPIEKTYNSWVVARPNDQFEWSTPAMHWSDITHPKGPKLISSMPLENQDNVFYFQVHGDFDKLNPASRAYPNMKIQLSAPIEIKNQLPYDFTYTVEDKTDGNVFTGRIHKGETGYLQVINNVNHVALSIQLEGVEYSPSDFVDIKVDATDDRTKTKQIRLTDKENNAPLDLMMNIARLHKTSNAMWINVFAPYLILNKTGFPVAIKSRASYRQSKQPAYTIGAFEGSPEVTPFMFSFPEIDRRNRAQLSVNGSKMSDPLSFEAVGSVQDAVLQPENSSQQIHVGVHVQEGTGKYHLTKVVTIAPRFVLKNNLGIDVQYREFASDEGSHIIEADQRQSLYRLSKSNVRWLCLRRDQEDSTWSAPFDLQQIGDNYIKLEQSSDQEPLLVRVSIVLQQATIFVFLETEKAWPYMLLNLSSVPVTFSQEATGLDEYKLSGRQKKAVPSPRVFELLPGEKIAYSWCMPVAHEKRIKLDIYGKTSVINFQAIGMQVPIRYKKQQQAQTGQSIGPGIMSLDVVAVESALHLRLTDFDSKVSPFRPKSSGASTAASSTREGSLRDTFEAVSINHVVNFALELNLANIGISIINQRVQEMAYTTVRDLRFKYTDSNQYQSIRASIQWLQIDNQFHGSIFPILFYPTTLPKNSVDDQTPTFHLALDLVKDYAHGVYNFKLFSVLLQEMTFEMDEDFLYCLLEFTQFASAQQDTTLADTILFQKTIPEPKLQQVPEMYYFQEFYIQPMRLNLSFVRTDRLNAAEASEDETSRSPFRYAFDVFTMAIGNVNDAPIKLNALIVENLRVSSSDLVQRITLHYRDEVIFQVHKVLGSVDFLGNPVGLFSTLSSGFGELFYEPYQGFIMSDRPQDLGIGIARGVGGFMKKSVFGVTDSVSRITGSIGKGLSAATMDKKFQDRRRMSTRNKPRHAMYGITQGATSFGSSVVSGVTGLVKRPMEGAESGGVIGFAGGVGRGLVGAVTKPLVGVFDLASNVSAGVRETTTIFDAGDITRERLPRYIAMDRIVRPFSQREALGQMWLKDLSDGKYYHDAYIAHCSTDRAEVMVLLTFENLLVVNTRKLAVEVDIRLDNVDEYKCTKDSLVVTLKGRKDPVAVRVPEDTSRQWLMNQVETTIKQRKDDKERH